MLPHHDTNIILQIANKLLLLLKLVLKGIQYLKILKINYMNIATSFSINKNHVS